MSETATRNADLDEALAEARAAHVRAHPQSLARHRESTAALPGGNTRTILHADPFPIGIARGEGCHLWSLEGRRYTDFLGEYTAGLFGHSHPAIHAAVHRALAEGINLGGQTWAEARFARAVCARFGLERVRFTNSGTEANLMALVTARAVTGRSRIIVAAGGYHGGVLTFAGGAAGPVNVPFEFVLAPYNDAAALDALARRHGPELAAILLEPMLGGGGCIPAEPGFLEAARAAATREGALFVLDEVMTSRLAPGGLQSLCGVRPDLTTLGKYVGGGMSFGAFGGPAAIMDRYDPARPDALPHAGTFNNNVLTMHAGLAALDAYTPEACRALNERGEALRARLNALCRAAGARLCFTGLGSMMAAHFTARPPRSVAEAARSDPRLKELFYLDMLAAGLWIARRGMIILSLPVGDAECDHLAGAVEEFLQQRRSLLAAGTAE